MEWDLSQFIMTQISDFLTRAETFARDSSQSLSTVSRKLLNDGKGLARLKEGGQCTCLVFSDVCGWHAAKPSANNTVAIGENRIKWVSCNYFGFSADKVL